MNYTSTPYVMHSLNFHYSLKSVELSHRQEESTSYIYCNPNVYRSRDIQLRYGCSTVFKLVSPLEGNTFQFRE